MASSYQASLDQLRGAFTISENNCTTCFEFSDGLFDFYSSPPICSFYNLRFKK